MLKTPSSPALRHVPFMFIGSSRSSRHAGVTAGHAGTRLPGEVARHRPGAQKMVSKTHHSTRRCAILTRRPQRNTPSGGRAHASQFFCSVSVPHGRRLTAYTAARRATDVMTRAASTLALRGSGRFSTLHPKNIALKLSRSQVLHKSSSEPGETRDRVRAK